MKLSDVFKASAALALVAAIVVFVWTYQFLGFFGSEASWYMIDATRSFVAPFFLALAVFNWYASETKDSGYKNAAFWGNFVLSAFGLGGSIFAQTAGRYNSWGWIVVLVYLVFTLAYLYYGIMRNEVATVATSRT